MSNLYQKIPSPFVRDEKTNKLIEGEWSSEELAALADLPIWDLTEKIDGTNIRVMWDGYCLSFGGRTNNADIPQQLLDYLHATFGERHELFEQKFGLNEATLYGEGYGPKIQSGGMYRKDVSFALFDVRVGEWDLLQENVIEVASYFGVDYAPVIAASVTLYEAIDIVRNSLTSDIAYDYTGMEILAEGVVAKTNIGLKNRRGERIVVKLKRRDLV